MEKTPWLLSAWITHGALLDVGVDWTLEAFSHPLFFLFCFFQIRFSSVAIRCIPVLCLQASTSPRAFVGSWELGCGLSFFVLWVFRQLAIR